MSTSAITPIPSSDYGGPTATVSQQSVFTDLIKQLKQAIQVENRTGTQTFLNAIEALSPSSAGSGNALGEFLTAVGTALKDSSATDAQNALATYLGASSTSANAPEASGSSADAVSLAGSLVQGHIQLDLVTSLLTGAGDTVVADSTSPSPDGLLNILDAAYNPGSSDGAASAPLTADSSTPYDTLVSAIQNNLDTGSGVAQTAIAYLNPSGNFVNTFV